ncbi:MAG TPA: hypothetical protein VF736_15950 [Pyrinomonadaceae bacterium]|jgi:hypothetical protein
MNKDVLLLALLGLFFTYLGYAFKVRLRVDLLSGLDAGKVRDTDGLAGWAGANMFLLAALSFAAAALQFLYPNLSATLYAAFGAAVVLDALVTVAGGRRYLRRAGGEGGADEPCEGAPGRRPPVAQLDAKERTPLERVLRDEEKRDVRR